MGRAAARTRKCSGVGEAYALLLQAHGDARLRTAFTGGLAEQAFGAEYIAAAPYMNTLKDW